MRSRLFSAFSAAILLSSLLSPASSLAAPPPADPILEALEQSDPLKAAIAEVQKRLKAIEDSADPPAKKEAALRKFFTDFNRARHQVTVDYVIEKIRVSAGQGGDWNILTLAHPTKVHKPIEVSVPPGPLPAEVVTKNLAVVSGILAIHDEKSFNLYGKEVRRGQQIVVAKLSFSIDYRGTPQTKKIYLILTTTNAKFSTP